MAPTTQVSVHENGLQNGVPAKSGIQRSINNGEHYEVPCNPLLMQQKGSLRSVVSYLTSRPNPDKSVIGLALGDASSFPCFRSGRDALTKPVFDVVDSALFDGYPPSFGYPFARRAVAEYLGCGIREGDVYLMSGATQAIQLILSALAGPGHNILLPRPGFPIYTSACHLAGIKPRFYDLLPSSNWELNPFQLMSLADCNTVAIIVINPNNPCGVVYPRSHLLQVEVQTTILTGISDDMDFARELMEEESVLVLPASVIGLKNWVRIFFGAPVDLLNEAFDRIQSFCERRRFAQLR
ncbi:putative aminotransferase TAT2 [Acorus gramineus]|uniref:Aminotransferase TAT2 n=1 Tax=Acorus gramineus TaxID=55184 RepID=A0AAV9BAI0_ACOGR|nr:putative aminotransferase TAT2 [Acorus gramineus]